MVANIITGRFIKLRTAGIDDARFTLEVRQNDNNTRYMPKLDISIEQQKKWIESQRNSQDSFFFVVERLNGDKIGTFSLYNIVGDSAESGRMIIRGNQMESIETVLLFHDFAFFTYGLNMVYSEIEKDNLPAQGIARSVGAINEGFVDSSKKDNMMLKFVLRMDNYKMSRVKLCALVERFSNRKRKDC